MEPLRWTRGHLKGTAVQIGPWSPGKRVVLTEGVEDALAVQKCVPDVAAWAVRIARGNDTLNDHAINGFDGDAATPMLAKGGRVDLSDQEIIDAVAYMVTESQ